MADNRRTIMHAAVAAGGASAALMSAAAHADSREIAATAANAVDPLIRALSLTIEAAGPFGVTPELRALGDVVADYLEPQAQAPEERL